MKSIITLTTDFGLGDHYVGVMKGVVLSINENAALVDVTHSIASHDVGAASFVVGNSYRFFPEGTVHLVVVDPGVGSERRPLAIRAAGHFFVGPDNGVFSSVLHSRAGVRVHEITNGKYFREEVSSTFHGRDVFSPVAAHLSLGVSLSELGPEAGGPEILPEQGCSAEGGRIRGAVVYADKFGNLVTSIPTEVLRNKARAEVSVGGKTIRGVSRSYSSAAPGEILAVGGSSGYVEISVNRGSARDALGAGPLEVVITDDKELSRT